MIVLDRYEGDFAVIEQDGVMKSVPKKLLEPNIPEGSVIVEKNGRYVLDNDETTARRKKIAELQNSLFED